MRVLDRLLFVFLFGAGTLGCVPEIDDRVSIISLPRVIALRSNPPEAPQGQRVEVTAATAAPDDSEHEVDFALCLDRKPLTELGPVSAECLVAPEEVENVVTLLERGQSSALDIPSNACTLFGPERPNPKPGEPAPRPVDPDQTGGFHQPVLAWLGQEVTLGSVRLSCPLSAASRDATIEFNQRYRRNENPVILGFERVLSDGEQEALDAEASHVAPGEQVRLRVRVPSCPSEPACGDGICGAREDRVNCARDCDDPKGCGGAEPYVVYDREAAAVREAREQLVAAWYATSGRFAVENSAPEGSDLETLENVWTAPPNPGRAKFWVVVRDDRGGVDWREGELTIE